MMINPLNSMVPASSPETGLPAVNNKNLKKEQAEQVAQDFETIFVEMMLKSMRNTAKPEDESNAQNIYQGMLDSEYSKNLAHSSSFGIRDLVLGWMKENDSSLQTSLPPQKP